MSSFVWEPFYEHFWLFHRTNSSCRLKCRTLRSGGFSFQRRERQGVWDDNWSWGLQNAFLHATVLNQQRLRSKNRKKDEQSHRFFLSVSYRLLDIIYPHEKSLSPSPAKRRGQRGKSNRDKQEGSSPTLTRQAWLQESSGISSPFFFSPPFLSPKFLFLVKPRGDKFRGVFFLLDSFLSSCLRWTFPLRINEAIDSSMARLLAR